MYCMIYNYPPTGPWRPGRQYHKDNRNNGTETAKATIVIWCRHLFNFNFCLNSSIVFHCVMKSCSLNKAIRTRWIWYPAGEKLTPGERWFANQGNTLQVTGWIRTPACHPFKYPRTAHKNSRHTPASMDIKSYNPFVAGWHYLSCTPTKGNVTTGRMNHPFRTIRISLLRRNQAQYVNIFHMSGMTGVNWSNDWFLIK